MKKISIILCVSVLLSCFCVYSTQTVQADAAAEEFSLLRDIGIIEEDVVQSATVTRGDFARILAKSAGSFLYIDEAAKSVFSDVNSVNSNAAYICAVSSVGLMNGVGDGSFASNAEITVRDAAVSFVRLCGYEKAAQFQGGYPSGYLYYAQQTKILSGINFSNNDVLTYETLIKMTYNALRADIYKVKSIGELIEFESTKGENVLAEYHNIYKSQGIVTANRYTSVSLEQTACSNKEIEIDKIKYSLEENKYEELIGCNVTAYYRKASGDDIGTVVSACENVNRNNTVSLSDDEIESVDSTQLKAYKSEKTYSYSLMRALTVIYNNKVDINATAADLKISDGIVKLIDNNNDRIYDIAYITEYKTIIVDSVDRTEYIVYGNKGERISFAHTQPSSYLTVYDTDGNEMYFDSIKTGNVLSVIQSKDNNYVCIYSSRKTVNGNIMQTDLDNDTYTISVNNVLTDYKAVKGFEDNFRLNLNGIFYLDIFGRLVYSQEQRYSLDYSYGYLVRGDAGKGFEGMSLLILTDVDFEQFNCNDKIMLDGISSSFEKSSNNAVYSAGKFFPQLIRFKCDAQGYINAIDTVSVGNGNEWNDKLTLSKQVSGTYNDKFLNFGNQCTFDSDTLLVKAPTLDEYLDDTDYYSNDRSLFAVNSSYTVNLYDLDDTLKAGAIVYNSNSLSVSGNINDYSRTGIVINVLDTVNGDGEKCSALRVFEKNTMKEAVYYLDEKYNLDMNLQFGDIILFITDADNNIMKYEYDFDYSAGDVTSQVSTYDSYFTKFVGYVHSKKTGFFSLLNIKDNQALNTGYDFLRVFPTDVMVFIEVDKSTQKVTSTSYENLQSYPYPDASSYKSFVKVYRGGGYYADFLVMYKE